MVHTDIPHIRVNVSSSPLVSCYHGASGCSDSETLDSSSYLLRNRPSASSSALFSSLSQSTLSSSQSDSQVLTANSRIPATAILALLDLLDAFDADVETQVAHLKENIKETRELVVICRAERVEKLARACRKKEAIERGTLAADSEFWCSI